MAYDPYSWERFLKGPGQQPSYGSVFGQNYQNSPWFDDDFFGIRPDMAYGYGMGYPTNKPMMLPALRRGGNNYQPTLPGKPDPYGGDPYTIPGTNTDAIIYPVGKAGVGGQAAKQSGF